MKKDDIKSALGKIEPSEELIQATLLKMQEQKQKEKNSLFSFISSFMASPVYRYAGAFCALALVIVVGVGIFGNGKNPSNVHGRNADNTGVTSDTGINMVAFTLDDYEHESAAVVKGKLKACFLSVVTDEEAADGSVASGALEIAVSNVEDGAGYVALEGASGTSISAKIYFASKEEINTLVGLMAEEMYFSIVPEEKDGEAVWKVTDFSLEKSE
ncbi:MAG: hypothetical protein E7261_06300 [Lachnospiraceae bacterium]|nr:hypothetical protein [Lachnospiraceae bacterium]